MALKPAAKKVVDAFINGATEVPQPRSSDFHVERGVLKVNSTRLAELSADGFYIIWVGHGGTDYQDSAYRYLKKNVPKKWFKDEPHSLSRNGRGTIADDVSARELVLFADNTDGLTPMGSMGQGKSIHENMMRKIRSGKFDPMKVPKALEYLMETAAKQYARDFASPGEWSQMFNAATRRMAASMMAEDYLDELAAQGLI